jgi:hypothetical protein
VWQGPLTQGWLPLGPGPGSPFASSHHPCLLSDGTVGDSKVGDLQGPGSGTRRRIAQLAQMNI